MSTEQSRLPARMVLVFLAAMALNGLDATIITPGLATIATEFGVSDGAVASVEWGFLVAAGLTLPAAGWAGRRWLPARALACCAVVFALGCALAAVAPGLTTLVLARAVQGMASGLMVPIALVMVYDGATGADRLRIAQWTTLPLTVIPMTGPLVGGAMTQHLGWRSLFVALFVLSVLVAVGTWRAARGQAPTGSRESFDAVGLFLLSTAVLLATVALPLAGRSVALGLACICGAVPLAALAWRWCRTAGRALDLAPLQQQTFRAGLGITALSAAAVNALVCAVPILLVSRHGHSATDAGLALAAESVGLAVGARLVSHAHRFGVRRWTLAAIAATVPCTAALTVDGRWALVACSVALAMVGILLGQPTMLGQVLAFDGLAPEQMSSATVLLMGLRSLASAWGVVMVGLVLSRPDAALWCALSVAAVLLLMLLPTASVPGATWAAAVGPGGPADPEDSVPVDESHVQAPEPV